MSRSHAYRTFERSAAAAASPLPPDYPPRRPEQTVLYELVSAHREPMLRHMRDVDPKGYGLPRHVDRELEAFMRCGILAHGFTRVRCGTCHDELLVAFSCKHRGLCPSCTARRMANTAAHLLDRVLPQARYRQWVFTVPKSLRLRLAREPAWASWVNRLIVRAIAVWQRRRARALGVRNTQTGAITFVQRFGGLLNLNVQYHLVVPDGMFVVDDTTKELSVLELRGPTNDELLAILDRVADRIGVRLADEAGDRDDADDDVDMPPDLWSQLQIRPRQRRRGDRRLGRPRSPAAPSPGGRGPRVSRCTRRSRSQPPIEPGSRGCVGTERAGSSRPRVDTWSATTESSGPRPASANSSVAWCLRRKPSGPTTPIPSRLQRQRRRYGALVVCRGPSFSRGCSPTTYYNARVADVEPSSRL